MTVVLALLMLLATAPAEAEEACATIETVKHDVADWRPAPSVTVLSPAATRVFLDTYNAIPPRSDMTAEVAAIIEQPDRPIVVVVTFAKGCATRTYFFPQDFLQHILGVST